MNPYTELLGDLPVKPPYYRHLRGKWAEFQLEHGYLAPEWCLAKISRGRRWWDLDDVLLEHARPDNMYIPELHCRMVRTAIIPGVVEALGRDAGRLRLRALPSLEELASVVQRLTDAAERRHERLYRSARRWL